MTLAVFTIGVTFGFDESEDVEVAKPVFTVFHEFGRFEKALSENILPVKAQWVHRTKAELEYKALAMGHLALNIKLAGHYWIPTRVDAEKGSRIARISLDVPKLNASYAMGDDPDDPFLKLTAGVFIYKYNKSAMNLGEYLFRSGAYPGWIGTGGLNYVGVNAAKLVGLHLNHKIGDVFSHDLLITLENQIIPYNDVNFTYMAQLNLNNVLVFGAGVQLARFLAANPSVTSPKVDNATYFELGGKTYVARGGYYAAQIGYIDDEIERIDSLLTLAPADPILTAQKGQWEAKLAPLVADKAVVDSFSIDTDLDPGYKAYSASAIKPVFHFTFDPKPLIDSDIFGPHDLTLFAEGIILGVKNQPIYYEDINDRIAVMFGINIPSFGLLDILSLQFENYMNDKFPNSTYQIQNGYIPVPTIPDKYNPDDWGKDNWKWSVFFKKGFANHFYIMGQVARDNARGFEYPSGKTDWVLFTDKDHWYWMMQFRVTM